MTIWVFSSSDIALYWYLNVLNFPAYNVINNPLTEVYFTIDQFTQFMRTFWICNSNFNYQPDVSNSRLFLRNCCGSFAFIYSKICSVSSTTIVQMHTYLSQTQTHTCNTHVLLLCVCVCVKWFQWLLSDQMQSFIRSSLWYLFMFDMLL